MIRAVYPRRLLSRADAELLLELIRARLKASDHNSTLGMLWSLIGPTTMMAVMYFVFSTRFGGRLDAYPLYLLIGIVLVSFFVTCTRYMIVVLLGDRRLLLNSTVPRGAVLISAAAVHVQKLLVELALCGLLSAIYGLITWRGLALVAPLVVAYVALAVGAGMVLAMLFAFARDVEHVWIVSSWVLFFVSPVFYALDSLSPLAATAVYWLNPLTPFVLAFRDALIGGGGDLALLAHSLVLGAAAFAIGCGALWALGDAAVERA